MEEGKKEGAGLILLAAPGRPDDPRDRFGGIFSAVGRLIRAIKILFSRSRDFFQS